MNSGRSYWWFACGKSAKQPFCDRAYNGSQFTPVKFEATESRKVWFCACKHAARQPLCDGTHKAL